MSIAIDVFRRKVDSIGSDKRSDKVISTKAVVEDWEEL